MAKPKQPKANAATDQKPKVGTCQCGYGGPFKLRMQDHILFRICRCGEVKNMDQ